MGEVRETTQTRNVRFFVLWWFMYSCFERLQAVLVIATTVLDRCIGVDCAAASVVAQPPPPKRILSTMLPFRRASLSRKTLKKATENLTNPLTTSSPWYSSSSLRKTYRPLTLAGRLQPMGALPRLQYGRGDDPSYRLRNDCAR